MSKWQALHGNLRTRIYGGRKSAGSDRMDATLDIANTALLLGSDGMMYGTLLETGAHNLNGGLFMYNPTAKVVHAIIAFWPNTGASRRAR